MRALQISLKIESLYGFQPGWVPVDRPKKFKGLHGILKLLQGSHAFGQFSVENSQT